MVTLYNGDCLDIMQGMEDNSVEFILTDIPYAKVNRNDNGLRNLDKEYADELTFSINNFLECVYRIANGSICIFCGREQFSEIYSFFATKDGTSRTIVWEKTNPSPMNAQYVYESGIELAVWFKKVGYKTFNAFCKNTVFKYPSGSSKQHPTQKNLELFEELILDNTNEGDTVFDPCMGSGTTGIACNRLRRNFIGVELNKDYFEVAKERIDITTNLKVYLW